MMISTTKPTDKAFILDPDKAEAFFNNKTGGAKKVLDRFLTHQPKQGVVTPYKGN